MKKNYLEGCRPFLSLDGCHLRGSFGGVLFCAIFIDENKGLFHVAYIVVEVECKDIWRFFLEHLYFCIDSGIVASLLIIMSDKQRLWIPISI